MTKILKEIPHENMSENLKETMTKNVKGKLIVIDGADGTGKATQTKATIDRLRQNGFDVETLDFPRYYDNFFGGLIGECLAGKHGSFIDVDPYIASVLYAADRFESKDVIKGWLAEGKTVILDRYCSSNQIHQGGKIQDPEKRRLFLEWLDLMEHDKFGIPRPDLIIYLDVSLELSKKLLAQKSNHEKKKYSEGAGDQHENSAQHQHEARISALSCIKEYNNWESIECTKNDEMGIVEMRSIVDVNDDIVGHIKKIIL